MGNTIIHIAELALLVLILLIVIKIQRSKIIIKPEDKPWLANSVFFINHNLKLKGDIVMVKTPIDKKFSVKWPSPVDKGGNEAQVEEGSVVISSDDETVATVEPDPDNGPYACIVHTTNKVGATAIKIKADADLGEGVKEINGMLAVEVTAGEATGFGEPSTTDPVDDEDED